MADKIHQQVDAAGQKLKNEDLRIESRNNTEQKISYDNSRITSTRNN